MTNETILGEEISPETAAQDDQSEAAETTSYLNQIVGEDKKYRDPESLAKSYVHASGHIQKLEAENEELRGQATKLDEVLKRLEDRVSTHEVTEPVSTTTVDAGTDQDQSVDVKSLVRAELEQLKTEEIHKSNLQQSRSKLNEIYGSKAKVDKALQTILNDNPAMASVIDQLGATNPDQLVRTVTALYQEGEATPNDPTTAGSSALHKPTGDGYISWAEAKEVMKKDYSKYKSREFQKLIEASAEYYTAKGQQYFN